MQGRYGTPRLHRDNFKVLSKQLQKLGEDRHHLVLGDFNHINGPEDLSGPAEWQAGKGLHHQAFLETVAWRFGLGDAVRLARPDEPLWSREYSTWLSSDDESEARVRHEQLSRRRIDQAWASYSILPALGDVGDAWYDHSSTAFSDHSALVLELDRSILARSGAALMGRPLSSEMSASMCSLDSRKASEILELPRYQPILLVSQHNTCAQGLLRTTWQLLTDGTGSTPTAIATTKMLCPRSW